MVIKQGDIFWVNFGRSGGSKPSNFRPAVVIQSNTYNESRINTAVVVAVTSKLKYENIPGNVRLLKGEANIPKASVVNVSSITVVDKEQLIEKIGHLSQMKINNIKAGLKILFDIE